MLPALTHDMSPDELDALIFDLGLRAEVLHVKIVEKYGSIHDAVMYKQNGDALASNLLRERGKLLKEKREWQRDLSRIKPKGPF